MMVVLTDNSQLHVVTKICLFDYWHKPYSVCYRQLTSNKSQTGNKNVVAAILSFIIRFMAYNKYLRRRYEMIFNCYLFVAGSGGAKGGLGAISSFKCISTTPIGAPIYI